MLSNNHGDKRAHGGQHDLSIHSVRFQYFIKQFHFTGPDGYDWYLISDKGKGSRHEGTLPDPTCTVTVSLQDWHAIQRGELNRLEAWSTGRLVTEGDLNVMMQLEDMIAEFT